MNKTKKLKYDLRRYYIKKPDSKVEKILSAHLLNVNWAIFPHFFFYCKLSFVHTTFLYTPDK